MAGPGVAASQASHGRACATPPAALHTAALAPGRGRGTKLLGQVPSFSFSMWCCGRQEGQQECRHSYEWVVRVGTHGRRCDQRGVALCSCLAGALQQPCGTLSIALAQQSARESCPPLTRAKLTCRVGLWVEGRGQEQCLRNGNVSEVGQALVARRQHGAVVGGRRRRTKCAHAQRQPSFSTHHSYLSLEKLTLPL